MYSNLAQSAEFALGTMAKRSQKTKDIVLGYIKEYQSILKKTSKYQLFATIPQAVKDICLSYYSVIVEREETWSSSVEIYFSDRPRHRDLFMMTLPEHTLCVDCIELQTLASDQDWGNTGFGSFKLVIQRKIDGKDATIKHTLITINHDDHPGFHQYEKTLAFDREEDKKKLDEIQGGDTIIIQCECAPWPGWQLKVKNAKIKITYSV